MPIALSAFPRCFLATRCSGSVPLSPGPNRLVAHLLYGSGLRLSEALRLRVKELDFNQDRIHVRDGKGGKDRTTVLPERLHDPLRRPLKTVKAQHEKDCAEGVGCAPPCSTSTSWSRAATVSRARSTPFLPNSQMVTRPPVPPARLPLTPPAHTM